MTKKYVTKNDFVYKELKEDILNGRLHPGERLIVSDIASRFDVSPMPIREALVRLQQEDLVDIIPHIGARVVPLNVKKFLEIVTIRVELETLAAKLATAYITEEQIVCLRDIVRQMEEKVADNDAIGYEELNRKFHDLVYSECQNQQLYELVTSLWDKSQISRTVFSRVSNHTSVSIMEHKKWLEGIISRDPERVAAVVRAHKERAFKRLCEVLEKENI